MGVQEIIVTAIGVLVVAYIVRRLYCIFVKRDINACECCDKSCPMKRQKRNKSDKEPKK